MDAQFGREEREPPESDAERYLNMHKFPTIGLDAGQATVLTEKIRALVCADPEIRMLLKFAGIYDKLKCHQDWKGLIAEAFRKAEY